MPKNDIPDLSEYLDRDDMSFAMLEAEEQEDQTPVTVCSGCGAPLDDNTESWDCDNCSVR